MTTAPYFHEKSGCADFLRFWGRCSGVFAKSKSRYLMRVMRLLRRLIVTLALLGIYKGCFWTFAEFYNQLLTFARQLAMFVKFVDGTFSVWPGRS